MLATALATMDQPVFVLGLDRRVWYANPAAAREYGYSSDELVSLTFDTLVASAVPARRVGHDAAGAAEGRLLAVGDAHCLARAADASSGSFTVMRTAR
mgnify:CR=1 FL=1